MADSTPPWKIQNPQQFNKCLDELDTIVHQGKQLLQMSLTLEQTQQKKELLSVMTKNSIPPKVQEEILKMMEAYHQESQTIVETTLDKSDENLSQSSKSQDK